ncbi:hypothetical protein [Streptomyces erythrochromogenes]|uniref:hypothetical protein n=1 Tax=Streptomyces erythrochromogenes TaxID=285574 RepID=UPI003867A9FE|nr:hypothetical protein OG364_29560 [Streptomyces erythrochromogenes]
MADERITAVRLGAVIRARAETAAALALAAGTCGHPGAGYVSAADPEAGVWCMACGDAPVKALLLTYWCPTCTHPVRAGLTLARVGTVEVAFRTCGCCLTADHPKTRPTPTERTPR